MGGSRKREVVLEERVIGRRGVVYAGRLKERSLIHVGRMRGRRERERSCIGRKVEREESYL